MKPELLAPAGNFDSLKAAVQNGADAVYLGLTKYSARSTADNFTKDTLKTAVDYCHLRGALVYLTLNTTLSDKSLNKACELAEFAYSNGVDAILVQDLGLAKLLRKRNIPLHASTQMTVTSLSGAKYLADLGFTRVVLARELSLGEIENISVNAGIETEVFCHGALCMCYSGSCYMSFFQGGRSGNKGNCAQPCRLPYTFLGKNQYHLSPGDLCTLTFLDKLLKTKTSSIKIEGRLKNPEYVGLVTGIYRNALDKIEAGAVPFYEKNDLDNLALAFSRSSFTSGHILSKMKSSEMALDTPMRVGLPVGVVLDLPKTKKGPVPIFTIKVGLNKALSNGDGIGFKFENGGLVNAFDEKSSVITVAGNVPKSVHIGDTVFQTFDKKLNEKISATYTKGEHRKSKINIKFIARVSFPVIMEFSDCKNNSIKLEGPVAETATACATSKNDIKKAIGLLGDTPYETENLEIILDDNIFIPLSAVKNLRREAVIKLNEARTRR